MYVCVYVCMYLCVYVCMYVCVYVCVCASKSVCACTRVRPQPDHCVSIDACQVLVRRVYKEDAICFCVHDGLLQPF